MRRRELLYRAPFARLREGVRRMPLRRRVGVLAALGVGLAILITAMAAYATVRVQLTQGVDENLLNRANQVVSSGLVNAITTIPEVAFLAGDIKVASLHASGAARSAEAEASAPPMGEPELEVARGQAVQSVRTASQEGVPYRVVAVPAGPEFALVLGQPTETVDRVLDQLGLVSVVAGGLGIGLAAWAGASIARAGLRPVERLTAAAEHVAATGELDPIEVSGDDEIARLTHAFNAMLSALEEARTRQRRLVADAGHELRTPLTSLRTNLDLLAQSDREGGLDGAERAELIDDVRAQITELSTLVTDLMELSRENAPQADLQSIDLADVVRDALSRVRRRAPHIRFSADLRPWLLEGDARLLGRAATNLLDNAAKWSPPGGTVWVSLRDGVLEVDDEGSGITEDDLPHVFERFYRSSEARSHPGSGLGLAIVRTAALRHGGTVSAGRAPTGGARLTMSLPRRDSSSALV